MPEVPPVSGTSGLTDQVAASFSETGALARVVDGYEPRDGQRRMAFAVADIIRHGGTLILTKPDAPRYTLPPMSATVVRLTK